MMGEFSEEEMIDYLLMHGYVIFEQVKIIETNVYQNVFQEDTIVVTRAIKDGQDLPIKEAFRKQLKKQLLNQI